VESRKALDLTARDIIALARSAWMSRESGFVKKADLVLAIDASPKLHAGTEYW
jgi:hypothetical protein